LLISLLGSCCPAGGSHGTALTPSNRRKPNSVPSQRYPSAVCAIDRIMPSETPSPFFHAVCAYWLTSRDGSSAKAQGQPARRMPSAITEFRRLSDLFSKIRTPTLDLRSVS